MMSAARVVTILRAAASSFASLDSSTPDRSVELGNVRTSLTGVVSLLPIPLIFPATDQHAPRTGLARPVTMAAHARHVRETQQA